MDDEGNSWIADDNGVKYTKNQRIGINSSLIDNHQPPIEMLAIHEAFDKSSLIKLGFWILNHR